MANVSAGIPLRLQATDRRVLCNHLNGIIPVLFEQDPESNIYKQVSVTVQAVTVQAEDQASAYILPSGDH